MARVSPDGYWVQAEGWPASAILNAYHARRSELGTQYLRDVIDEDSAL